MDNKKNEEWLTRRHFKRGGRVGVSKKRTFAAGLLISLDKPKVELDEILSLIPKEHE